MEIKYIKGNKAKGDHKFYIKTDNGAWECITIAKVALILNQIAINELIINGDAIKRNNKFHFEEAMTETITMARQGIDWADERYKDIVFNWAKKYRLRPESIDSQLRRSYQAKLNLESDKNGKP